MKASLPLAQSSPVLFCNQGQYMVICNKEFRHFDETERYITLTVIIILPHWIKQFKDPPSSLSHLIYPITMKVVGAPQMILQPLFSIFPCSPLPSGTCWTPGLSIPWCCLPTSSPVCLVFFPLSLCLARWFWPDLMNRRHDHTTAVCVFLRSSGDLHVVLLPAGSWHRLPRW